MRVVLIATMSCLLWACSNPPAPKDGAAAGEAPASQTAESKNSEPQSEDSKGAEAKPPELSDEDKRLIALDPAELTPELRRKRAYALRRKAMQDPNSPLARTLEDLKKASENGEIDPNGSDMPTFTVDGKPPTSGKGPAGARTGPAGAKAPAQ